MLNPEMRVALFSTTLLTSLACGVSMRPDYTPTSTPYAKSKVCPDQWYINLQPTTYQDPLIDSQQRKREMEYFVINGQRWELAEFDLDWVRQNCRVNKPTLIY